MKKIRNYLAVFVLTATLFGSVLLGIGAGAMANVASSWHANSHFAAEQSARSVAFRSPRPPCSTGGGTIARSK